MVEITWKSVLFRCRGAMFVLGCVKMGRKGFSRSRFDHSEGILIAVKGKVPTTQGIHGVFVWVECVPTLQCIVGVVNSSFPVSLDSASPPGPPHRDELCSDL